MEILKYPKLSEVNFVDIRCVANMRRLLYCPYVRKLTSDSPLYDPHLARIKRDAEVEQQRSPRILERGNGDDDP